MIREQATADTEAVPEALLLAERWERAVPRYTSYPTAPHFHDGIGAETYGEWLAALPANQPLSLYLHIPYCDTLCWFCGCHTKITRRYEPVAGYLKVLTREVELVAEAIGGRRPVGHLAFGGGSPTLIQPDDVAGLAATLHRHFEFRDDTEFAVEIDPRDLTREMVAAWAAAGATRASLGVQDLSPEVQAAINRHQTLAQTAEAVDWLRRAGIRRFNIDLMYGLPHQTVARTLDTVEAILGLGPDRIALFGYAHVPWMKGHMRMIPEEALPDGRERWRQSVAAAERLIAAGYTQVGLDHFAKPDDPLAIAFETGTLRRNFQGYTTDKCASMIGFGASAIGELPQGYLQNTVPTHDYAQKIEQGELAMAKGLALSDDDRLRRHVIERLMCELSVDLADAARKFGTTEAFAAELAELAPMRDDGLVEIDGQVVRITETGRPLMRMVAAAFDSYLGQGTARHSRAI